MQPKGASRRALRKAPHGRGRDGMTSRRPDPPRHHLGRPTTLPRLEAKSCAISVRARYDRSPVANYLRRHLPCRRLLGHSLFVGRSKTGRASFRTTLALGLGIPPDRLAIPSLPILGNVVLLEAQQGQAQ